MTSEIIDPFENWKKPFIGLILVLVVATLVVYSPALSTTPLFDESYLMSWLANCLKSGLSSAESTAFILAPAADPRDCQTPFGASYILATAIFSGCNYSLMRYWQVFLHLFSALLLFLSLYLATVQSWQRGRAFALAAGSALCFCLFPLAPEAVSWLFSLPLEAATSLTLIATTLLLWPSGESDNSISKAFPFVALVAGALAPWLALKAALLVLLPLTLSTVQKGKAAWQGKTLIALAVIIVSSLAGAAVGLTAHADKPEAIKQLAIEKISLTGESEGAAKEFLERGAGANLQAMALPVNRKIDDRYNKVLRFLYFFLPLPILLFIGAALTNSLFRYFGPAVLGAVVIAAIGAGVTIDGESFYGARWFYPALPLVATLWAMLCFSPLFIEVGNRTSSSAATTERVIKIALCVIFAFSLSVFFFQRTYRQNLSYKSNGKLWKVIQQSILIAGQKQTSPFIIVRNLPQSLSIAPILSPFSPQLIDTQSGMPRTASLSAGRLKDCLQAGKYTGAALHYEKTYNGFVATDLKIIDEPFGPELDAKHIAAKLSPPLIYYNGAVKLAADESALLMESHTRVGPALRLTSYGLSPIDGDFLYIDAKIDVPAGLQTASPNLELHWLTNWEGDWEARDRKVITTGPVSDGQFHRYYFPLRTLAWTTSGLPTNLMLGFPGGATVALKDIGLCKEPIPLPTLAATAVHKQDGNKNYFSHYCFNYPDLDELGLCAVYGHDNGLDLSFDVSNIPSASEAIFEIVPLSEAFRNENSSEPLNGTMRMTAAQTKGSFKIASEKLGQGGLFSVRVFGASADHKIIGRASDSIKVLIDQRL